MNYYPLLINMKEKIKDLIKIISLPVLIASLCCLTPVILVLLGVSTISFAASLSNTLYNEHKWLFRGYRIHW